jgi:hypothetical protein
MGGEGGVLRELYPLTLLHFLPELPGFTPRIMMNQHLHEEE